VTTDKKSSNLRGDITSHEKNVQTVLEFLRQNSKLGFSYRDLANELGLPITTIRSIIRQLKRQQQVKRFELAKDGVIVAYFACQSQTGGMTG
jgi:DNA-binding MarR family transcriptional regulator